MTSYLHVYKVLKTRNIVENPIFNFVWFYVIWLALVNFGNAAIPVFIIFAAVHYRLVHNPLSELKLILKIAAIGIIADLLLSATNVFVFEGNLLMPLWLVCLWLAFASTINRGLKFLQKSWMLLVFLGGFGGASSYLTGNYFGAVEFGYGYHTTAFILFVHWAILFPIFIRVIKIHFKD